MKYLVVYLGPEGCDYSIGCGTKILLYEAEDTNKLINIVHENEYDDGVENTSEDYRDYFSRSDHGFTDIIVFPISSDGFSIKPDLIQSIEDDKVRLSELKNKTKTEEELEQYKKLKEKYG